MNTAQAFKSFPDAQELWEVEREAFLSEDEALAHAKHFNLPKPKKVARPTEKAETAKEAAEEKAAAEKAEAEQKAAAEKADKKGK